ncbi:hypothetical protein RJT34_33468 [Clitoria ternatea]|uniref:Uncharacterized protein n=1 Tax=Clitoria ternatea TaxID=43366 RepID=A0AAN9EXW2_CLITE
MDFSSKFSQVLSQTEKSTPTIFFFFSLSLSLSLTIITNITKILHLLRILLKLIEEAKKSGAMQLPVLSPQ